MQHRGRCRAGLAFLACLTLALGGCTTLTEFDRTFAPMVVAVDDDPLSRQAMNARVFDAAVRTVERKFYDRTFNGIDFAAEAKAARPSIIEQPSEEAFYGSLNILLDRLDDGHTSAGGPSFVLARWNRMSGSARTFGWSFALVENFTTDETFYLIDTVRPDGPAGLAGVRPGWLLVSVDDQPFVVADHTQRPHRFRFEDHLGVFHERELEAVVLPRELGRATRRDDGVVVLRIPAFDPAVTRWLLGELETLQDDPPAAIVLDVRANPGGEVDDLTRVAGVFFQRPVRLATYDYTVPAINLRIGGFDMRTSASRAPWLGRVAVLQNSLSGSSSEVLSNLFKHCRRGPIVGERSAGKVVGANEYRLPDGGALSVGVSSMLGADDRAIEKVGVEPDVLIAPTDQDIRTGTDAMLETAVVAALASQPDTRCGSPSSERRLAQAPA